MSKYTHSVIRLVRVGCTNRPFYKIVAAQSYKAEHGATQEQLGSFDPMKNRDNQKLVALNIEKIKHYLAHGAQVSTPVAKLLGLAGLLPIHPMTYIKARRYRKLIEEQGKADAAKKAEEDEMKEAEAAS